MSVCFFKDLLMTISHMPNAHICTARLITSAEMTSKLTDISKLR